MRSLGQPSASRWDELRHTASEVGEVATSLGESGVDVFFLNREPVLGIKSGSGSSLLSAQGRACRSSADGRGSG